LGKSYPDSESKPIVIRNVNEDELLALLRSDGPADPAAMSQMMKNHKMWQALYRRKEIQGNWYLRWDRN
jgi:hypothetical protein